LDTRKASIKPSESNVQRKPELLGKPRKFSGAFPPQVEVAEEFTTFDSYVGPRLGRT
jgi:hypothetical protein